MLLGLTPFFSTFLADAATLFGTVEPPQGVKQYDEAAQAAGGEIGLILFFSRLIRLGTIVGGIFVMVNLLYAGWIYLSSAGDSSAHEKVSKIIVNSLLGLGVIVASYAIAGLVGLVFFGDATFILQPTICGPGGCD